MLGRMVPGKGQALLLAKGQHASPICCCVQASTTIARDSVQQRSKLDLP